MVLDGQRMGDERDWVLVGFFVTCSSSAEKRFIRPAKQDEMGLCGGRAGGPATRKIRRGLYLGTLLHQHLSKRGRPNDAMAKAGKYGCINLAFGKMSFVFYGNNPGSECAGHVGKCGF